MSDTITRMIGRVLRMLLKFVALLLASGFCVLFTSRLITMLHAYPRLYSASTVPVASVAIVYGAGLWRDGTPTPVLRDRVATAVELYNAGKVQKILMSGDNRSDDYNEPAAMQAYAVRLGVPASAIVLDSAGQRTYDTCYRARHIFDVDQAILVTQGFHLPRALYTCRTLGMSVVGVAADRREYRASSRVIWNVRELLATVFALYDLHISRPDLVLGIQEPIFPTQSQ